MDTSRIRILVVDDVELFRRFICSALSKQPELQVIAEVSDGLEAVHKARELQPDLILLDIGLPRLNGIEAARQIRGLSPNSKILFVSQQESVDVVQAALDTGANGYVLKMDAGSQLLTGVNAVLDGKRFVSRSFERHRFFGLRDSRLPDDIRASSLAQLPAFDLDDSDDFHILLEDLLDTAISATDADFGNVQLVDPAGDDLRICVQRGFSSEFLRFFDRVHPGEFSCGCAQQSRSRVVVEDVSKSPIFLSGPVLEIMRAEEVRSVQSTPLISATNELLGRLNTHYRTPRSFSEHSLQQLDLVATRAVHLIERWKELQRAGQ